jgi:photosystem II stability/assembly factor-like uncharacterized protein
MKLIKYCMFFLFILMLCEFNYAQQMSFSSLNGPYGGNLGDIVFTSDGEIFVSAYYSEGRGVYKSTTNGNNWQHILPNSEEPWIDYFALGIDRNDIVFLGTSGGGLFKSTDRGNNWIRLTGYPSSECWTIAIDDSNFIFAGDGDLGGVYKSIDEGNTWTQVLPSSVAPLSIKINNEGTIFVGARDNFYNSTDNGQSWNSYYYGLDNQIISSILTISGSQIYVGTGYYSSGNGVYYSPDDGITWIQKGLNGKVIYSLTSDQFGAIYVATKFDGVYKTTDDGLTWQQINKGIENKNIFRVQFIPNNILLACSESEGGIYKSYDYGESWEISGVVAGTMREGFITNDGDIYSAVDGGIQKFEYKNGTWNIFGLQEVRDILIDRDSVLFAGTRWNGIFKSSDNGNTWVQTSSIGGIGIEFFTMGLYPDNSILLGTNDYIKISTDKGMSWNSITNLLPDAIIRNLIIGEDRKIYVTSGTTLCKADDLQSNFNILKDSLYAPDRNGLALGLNGLIFFSDSYFNQGIFRSSDYGNSWFKISDRPASSISVKDNKYIVTGHNNGEIMFSSDKGDSWQIISNELPFYSTIFWSQIDRNGFLYCAASGAGVFKSNSTVTSIEDVFNSEIDGFELYNNFPNPFNSITHIKYTVPTSGNITLKIYDIMGQEVATLIDHYINKGIYEVVFQPNKLVSGVYFYAIRSGDFVSTKKLILLK